jgi:hypothetical protein
MWKLLRKLENSAWRYSKPLADLQATLPKWEKEGRQRREDFLPARLRESVS